MKRTFFAGLFVLFLAGCSTSVPILNITDAPVVTSGHISSENVAQAIQTAAARRGWVVTSISENMIEASLRVRNKHKAVITISYSDNNYSIAYKDSSNLDHDGNKIHRNYNKWVTLLDREIQTEIAKQ